MRTISIARTLALAVAACTLGAPSSDAYVDVELAGGSHVKGDSYSSSDTGKLVVYRPSGAIEIDRSKVRSIREVEGSLSEPAAPAQPSVALAPAPAPAAPAAPAPAAAPQTKDPKEREHELAHQLMHMRLDRLAASQRGDEETLKKLDNEIGSLQKERIKNYKKLDPSFEVEPSK